MEHDCHSAVAAMGVVVCDFFTKNCEKNVGRAGWAAGCWPTSERGRLKALPSFRFDWRRGACTLWKLRTLARLAVCTFASGRLTEADLGWLGEGKMGGIYVGLRQDTVNARIEVQGVHAWCNLW